MTTAEIIGYPLVLIAGLEFFLGFLLLKQNPRNSPANKATAALALTSATWSLSAGIMYLLLAHSISYSFFARMSWIGWFTPPTALQSLLFLADERSRKARIVGWIFYPFWAVVLLLCLTTDLVVTDGYIPLPYENSPGPLEMPLRFFGSLLMLWVYVEAFRVRKHAKGYRRTQLNFNLLGIVIFGTGGAVIGGFLQLFTGRALEPSISAYFSFPWVVMIFYAITRYRLFDTRLVLSRALNILLLSAAIAFLQFALFKALEPAIGAVATITLSIGLISLLFFGTNLSRATQAWINELVIGRRYAYQTMLRQSADAMVTIHERDDLLQLLVGSVRECLGVTNACLFLREAGGGYVSKLCFGSYCRKDGPGAAVPAAVTSLLRGARTPVLRDDLETREGGSGDEAAGWMRERGAEIVIPLSCKGQDLGMLTLGERESGEPYLPSDIEVLQMLADHAAVAIENARLFEEAVRARASLRERENIFKVLTDTTAAAIIIHRGGKLLFANAAAGKLTGYPVTDLLTMDFWSIIHPEHRELVRARGQERLAGGKPPEAYELKVTRKDGAERWARVTAGMIGLENTPAVIATLMDITDLKRSEEARERLTAEKDKILKDLHDGIGGMSTNINLLAELAQKNDDIAAVRKSLSTISALARENLLEIRGFIQSRDAPELTWPAVVAELRHLGSAIIEPHGIRLSISTAVQEGPPGLRSSVTMNIFRIYKESLMNVVQHARATEVEVSFTVTGALVVLDIRDNGVGLAGKKGNGRGLVNMRARAEEIGGRFTLESGRGTHIVVEIPLPVAPSPVVQ